jgi:hypothetical protein
MTAPEQPDGARSTTVEAEHSAATEEAAEALAQADSLADQGNFLEAVELLSEQNRRDRDGEIEKRLVRLRNLAYEELDRSPTDAPWPDEAPRPRDAEEQLPPVSPADLAPEVVRDRILRYGCAYIPGLIPRQRADQLVEGIDRAFEVAQSHLSETPPP